MRSHCFLVFVVVLFTISCLGQQSLPLYSVSFTDHQGAQPTHLENSGPPGVAYWQQFAKLASPGKTNFKFAQSIAIDGATIVVGIPQAGHGMGTVLVVEKNGQSSTVAQLVPSDGYDDDSFGYWVAISGGTVVVGAATNPKKAYVFVRPRGGWTDMTETAQLSPSDSGNGFGPVAIDGSTIAVGGYVFVEPPGGWVSMTQTARLMESQPQPGDEFGSSVSVDSDTIVVGAPNHDIHGAVFVYAKPPSGWGDMTETAELTISSLHVFGSSVAISGNTLAVGAPYGSGTAFVFVEPQGGWQTGEPYTAKLTASDGGKLFGSAIATNGKLIVVGSPDSQNGSGKADGAVYSFTEPKSGWSGSMTETEPKLTASDAPANLYFGSSVSLSGQLLLTGAPGEVNLAQSGEVYAFRYISNSGFKAFVAPGGDSTFVTGLNNVGEIIGFGGAFGSFLYAAGNFTPIAYPGAIQTNAAGVNDNSEIVGAYYDNANVQHGFTNQAGVYTTLDYSGNVFTDLSGINDNGDIVGYYTQDGSSPCHGFLYSGGVFTALDVPGAQNTVPYGINSLGEIVGYYCAAPCSNSSGFLYSGGVFTPVNYPGASNTVLYGINDSGDMVGSWSDNGSGQRGPFVYWNQTHQFVKFSIGGLANTSANGINNSDVIVGNFVRNITEYGFYGNLPGH